MSGNTQVVRRTTEGLDRGARVHVGALTVLVREEKHLPSGRAAATDKHSHTMVCAPAVDLHSKRW